LSAVAAREQETGLALERVGGVPVPVRGVAPVGAVAVSGLGPAAVVRRS